MSMNFRYVQVRNLVLGVGIAENLQDRLIWSGKGIKQNYRGKQKKKKKKKILPELHELVLCDSRA